MVVQTSAPTLWFVGRKGVTYQVRKILTGCREMRNETHRESEWVCTLMLILLML
jgi:hypothetical protein